MSGALAIPLRQRPPGGILFVIAAPSGTGKTTLCRGLVERVPRLRFAVSATTRAPRPGERDGHDYHFVDEAGFQRRLQDDAFLEWAEVHGRHYGTPRAEWERARRDAVDLVLDIDTQGAFQVRERMPDSALVFVLPPSLDELERRIQGRAQDDAATIRRRLAAAASELAQAPAFDYVIVNDDLEHALVELTAIVRAERARARRVLDVETGPRGA